MHTYTAHTPRQASRRAPSPAARHKTRLAALLLTVPLLAVTRPAVALDLLDAWRAAMQHDPELAAAHAALDAGQTRHEQARSLWRPTIELNATAGIGHNEAQIRGAQFAAPAFGSSTDVSFDTSVRSGAMTQYAVTARQPLFDPARQAQSRQLTLSADSAQAEWADARQQLILRTAERYFDVLIAQKNRHLLRQQQTALQRMLEQTRMRFELGEAPILDIHEADARARAIEAQSLLADIDLQIKQAAFTALTGLDAQGLSDLRLDSSLLSTAPDGSLEDWLQRASRYNLALQKQDIAQSVAQEQANQHKPSSAPSLELVGSAGRSRLHGNGQFGDASSNMNDWMVGIQVRIPVYSGGYRSARYEEALHQRDKTRFEAQAARRQVELVTRAAWLSLNSGHSRIGALRQALIASQSRRDATRLGLSVEDRTILDWLDSENAVMQSSLALVQAMATLALDHLRLQAQAGDLDEIALSAINCALDGPAC